MRHGDRKLDRLNLEKSDQAFEPDCEPDGRGRRPADLGDEIVVPPTAAHRALRAELTGRPFEHGSGVVVETAHEAGVHSAIDAASSSMASNWSK